MDETNKKLNNILIYIDDHIILEERENKYSLLKLITYQSDK